MITVEHLTKYYGNHLAVDDISFEIREGHIYGLLGPNGAGKSTTMNIITGCLAASSGDVKIGGFDIFEEAEQAKKLIGYLPEQPPLYLDRTKGIPEKQIIEKLTHVMTVTGILDVADRLIKNLSKGYKQRVGIAQAILGDPKVIILDEPTVGLDPRQIIEIRDLIQELGKTHTVILSSHILSEVQAVCQTILIISKGKLVACDTPENLESLFAGTVTVELTAEGTEDAVRAILSQVPGIASAQVQSAQNGCCTLRLDAPKQEETALCREIFFAFSKADCPILQMKTAKASLEDIFMELTGSDGKEEAK